MGMTHFIPIIGPREWHLIVTMSQLTVVVVSIVISHRCCNPVSQPIRDCILPSSVSPNSGTKSHFELWQIAKSNFPLPTSQCQHPLMLILNCPYQIGNEASEKLLDLMFSFYGIRTEWRQAWMRPQQAGWWWEGTTRAWRYIRKLLGFGISIVSRCRKLVSKMPNINGSGIFNSPPPL